MCQKVRQYIGMKPYWDGFQYQNLRSEFLVVYWRCNAIIVEFSYSLFFLNELEFTVNRQGRLVLLRCNASVNGPLPANRTSLCYKMRCELLTFFPPSNDSSRFGLDNHVLTSILYQRGIIYPVGSLKSFIMAVISSGLTWKGCGSTFMKVYRYKGIKPFENVYINWSVISLSRVYTLRGACCSARRSMWASFSDAHGGGQSRYFLSPRICSPNSRFHSRDLILPWTD